MCVAVSTLAATGATTVTAEHAAPPSARFVPRSEEPLQQFRALRHMHAWSERFNQEAWMDAWTTLDHGRFEYTIVSERGSETIRNRVLRAILAREKDLVNSGDESRADLTEDNYDFAAAETDQTGATVVPIKPRRKDVLLVDGQMVLDPATGDVVRVEGRLAKNPSFWTSLVKVVRHYARLAGVRVPIATESTAKIKFVGISGLEMHYEYQSVNGQPVTLAQARR